MTINAYSKEVRLLSMKTTYFLTHESINCPICGKLLRESKSYDEVACSDPQCRFNDSHSKEEMPQRGESEIMAWQLYQGDALETLSIAKLSGAGWPDWK